MENLSWEIGGEFVVGLITATCSWPMLFDDRSFDLSKELCFIFVEIFI